MMVVNTYTCVAEFTQYAAIDALRDREDNTPYMVGEFIRRREQFVRDLNRVPGFRCLPPEGAFYAWVDITGTGISAEESVPHSAGRCGRGCNSRCSLWSSGQRVHSVLIRVVDGNVCRKR